MDPALARLVEAHAERGATLYARWDAALFRDLADTAARAVWAAVGADPGARNVAEAYLRLALEAVGAGYLDRAGHDALVRNHATAPAHNLIALGLVVLLPRCLERHPADDRVALLARLWNLGEGLLGAPPWLNRYVTASVASLTDLRDLEGRVAAALEPAVLPAEPSRWEGPFAVSLLDPRPLAADFLPGEMHLVAPRVLCVHDRRAPGVHAGVFLRRDGASQLVGPTPCLGPALAEAALPALRLGPDRLGLGAHTVALPHLREAHRVTAAAAGFVVASAVDSQRLWLVESAA